MAMDERTARGKTIHRRAQRDYRWEGVECLPYKEDDRALFKSVSRQILFSDPDLAGELRYFEVEPGGFSSLERHEHMHGVLILRGRGKCLVGSEVRAVEPHDLVTVPAWTWHQFRATAGEPLGFLCMVNASRDKPHLPSEADLAELKANPEVAEFLGLLQSRPTRTGRLNARTVPP
jgi:mannose-6-phosphate isomerase-like protein (cupin superfamily)